MCVGKSFQDEGEKKVKDNSTGVECGVVGGG